MASSEQRCIQLVDRTSARVASLAIDLLSSAASRTDLEGTRTAANLVRNLAMATPNRMPIGELPGIFDALLTHVGHRDPNTAAIVSAVLRILAEHPANARRAAESAATVKVADRGSEASFPRTEGTIDVFASVTTLEVEKLHPFCRAELCRFLCLVISATCAPGSNQCVAPALQVGVVTRSTLQFTTFLLASRHVPLHAEACSALLAARAVYRQSGQEWPIDSLSVISPTGERSLAQVLTELVQTGTLSQDDLHTLLERGVDVQ